MLVAFCRLRCRVYALYTSKTIRTIYKRRFHLADLLIVVSLFVFIR
jgi:hypothetical protein